MKSKVDWDEIRSLTKAIAAAAKEGVYDALRMHKRLGNSIATSRDGCIVWIPPEEIVVPETAPSADIPVARETK